MYIYEQQKKNIFTEEGQIMFIKIRDNAQQFLKSAGSFMMCKVIAGCTGDIWDMLACVDRLVELGEIREITDKNNVAGQHRIFIENKNI